MIIFQEGQYYHFFNRGNNKEKLFREEENYIYFLDLIKKYLTPVVDIYAYCLLSNHFHFVFRIKDKCDLPIDIQSGHKKLHQPFSNLFNAYTKAFNKKYGRSGSLFQKHPVKHHIDTEEYLKNVIIYVNLNPDHHNLGNSFQYKYSSYKALISESHTLIKRGIVIDLFEDIPNFKYVHNYKKLKMDILNDIILEDD